MDNVKDEHDDYDDYDDYGDECVIKTDSGRELRCPPYPEPCSYVRVVQDGREVAYWCSDEWRDDPEDVMGAVLGALCHSRCFFEPRR